MLWTFGRVLSENNLRILFAIRHPSYLRNLLGVIELLAERQHRLHFVFDAHGPLGEDSLFEEIKGKYKNVTGQFVEKGSKIRKTDWRRFSEKFRYGIDYIRYCDKRYSNAKALRYRAKRRSPFRMRRFADRYLSNSPTALKLALYFSSALEWSLPVQPLVMRFFDLFQPDIVVVTPLVGLGSDQVDWIKEAKIRGIPSVLPVASWDNLTNKGRLRVIPDRILVWNGAQRTEALGMHSVPSTRIHVCGAWSYDHWFNWQPTQERHEFTDLVGLNGASRFLLYVGSSPFIAPNEVDFCLDLVQAIRSNEKTCDLGILIRPHPQNAAQWEKLEVGEIEGVAIFPKSGANPIDGNRRNQYFDSIWHSEAVFGINTSAQIEGGILGRPVLTVLDRRFRATQEGTLHFHHLTTVSGGLLHTARSVGELADLLAKLLSMPPSKRSEKSQKFVNEFIRSPRLETAPSLQACEHIITAGRIRVKTARFDRWLGAWIRYLFLRRYAKFQYKSYVRKALSELRLAGDGEQ